MNHCPGLYNTVNSVHFVKRTHWLTSGDTIVYKHNQHYVHPNNVHTDD